MFNSKVFTTIIVLTLAVLGGAVALQVLEMNEYNLFETIQKSIFGDDSGSAAAAPAPAKEAKSKNTGDAKAKTE